jgi:hypothetical protein
LVEIAENIEHDINWSKSPKILIMTIIPVGPCFQALPAKRQTLLFSATLSDSIRQLKEVALSKDPFYWEQVKVT